MQFVKNNDKIDFAELERRISFESARLAGSALLSAEGGEPMQAVVPLAAETPHAEPAAGAKRIGGPPTRRSLRSRASVWMWAVMNLRVILRRAIAAVYAAAEALQRVGELENRLGAIEDQLRAALGDGENARRAIGELNGRVDTLTTTMMPLPWRFAALTAEVSSRLAAVASGPSATGIGDKRLDSLFAAMEDVFRGNRDDIKRALAPYLDLLRRAGAGGHDMPVLDIGCGRGEWLELLQENGLHAYGIDTNILMVERSVSFGVDALQADMMAHLGGIEDASRSAVTAFHLVEHLPLAVVVEFLDEALRVLSPGGVLILETPNPETVRVGATTFYRDPTHRNPLMPEVLRFIVEHRGFAAVELLKLHPFTEGLLQEKTEDAAMLNQVLFGPQNYAIVARRP